MMIENKVFFEKLGLIRNRIPKSYIIKIINYSVSRVVKKPITLCVVLASDIEIKKINKKFRNKNKITTCLSFPLFADRFIKSEDNVGDIFINLDRIKKYSQDYKKELAFNLIHSFLHLVGFSHNKDNDARMMENKEEDILKGFYEIYKKSN
jgi:probable rRNA maturation factor